MKKLAIGAATALLTLTLGGSLGGTALASESRSPGSHPVPPVTQPGLPFLDALFGGDRPGTPTPRQSAVDPPAARPTARPIPDLVGGAGQFAGYATGTLLHADALQIQGTRLANVDVAFSGASYASEALTGALANEMERIVAPVLGANAGFSRGSGLEVGLGIPADGDAQLILADLAEAASPPSTDLVTKQLGPLTIPGILKANLLRGQARSRSASTGCTIGSDLANGLGYVLDLDLLSLAEDFTQSLVSTSAENPERVLGQSSSRTRLIPKDTDDEVVRFGVMSESRQTILPVTFFAGTDNQFTVEVLGEWVLRASADGDEGSLFYGPADQSPETPILRIIDAEGEVTNIVTFQDLLGDGGFVLKLGDLAELAIGEDPRAIDGDAESAPIETGTLVLGAVDVVRVKLLTFDESHLADVRIGHMEAGVAVPEQGVECEGIGMAKNADRSTVKPGETFTWTIDVSNPNDCLLSDVKVVDTITATEGVKYEILSTEPSFNTGSGGVLTWNDMGDLGPGQSRTITIEVKVAPDSGTGTFRDSAVATGTCGGENVQGQASTEGQVPMRSQVALEAPEVTQPIVSAIPLPTTSEGPGTQVLGVSLEADRTQAGAGTLPRTGGVLAVLPALGLLGGGALLRRASRRRADLNDG